MSTETYELLAMAARYGFTALAVFIVFLGWRASVADNRNAKLLRDWSPQTGCIGELMVVSGGTKGKRDKLAGQRYPVPREGVLGSGRSADIHVVHKDVKKKHFFFEQRTGCLLIQPYPGAEILKTGSEEPVRLVYDGDRIELGGLQLMMVFYDADNAKKPEKPAKKQEDEYVDDFAGKEEELWQDDNPSK